jgi:hypothetical protein
VASSRCADIVARSAATVEQGAVDASEITAAQHDRSTKLHPVRVGASTIRRREAAGFVDLGSGACACAAAAATKAGLRSACTSRYRGQQER